LSPLLDANSNGKPKLPQAFDENNQYVGQYNKLDVKYEQQYGKANLNAMHTNWAGEDFSKGAFPENKV
jgi:hypothetical protein